MPRKVEPWYWLLDAWIRNHRKGQRPASAPHRPGRKFWTWRHLHLVRAKRAGKKQWKKHRRTNHPARDRVLRGKIVHHWKWGALPSVSPLVHYTEDARRDDWLVEDKPTALPMETDCSGWGTQGPYVAKAPDPNGLAYRYLGYTGTVLDFAYKHGTVTENLKLAEPGDVIVIGPGTGWHEVGVVEADPSNGDPIVSTHGSEGVQIQRVSVDPRTPKRLCKTL